MSELHSFIRSRWPGLPDAQVEDLASESIEKALVTLSCGSREPAQLVETAKLLLGKLKRPYFKRKQGWRVSKYEMSPEQFARLEDASQGNPFEPIKPCDPRRKPHSPKGVVEVEYPDHPKSQFDFARVVAADVPSDSTRAAAARLYVDCIAPALRGEPVQPNVREAIHEAYAKAFGHQSDHQWAGYILRGLMQECRRNLADASQRASQTAGPPPLSKELRILLTFESHGSLGGHAKREEIPAKVEAIRHIGAKTYVDLTYVKDGFKANCTLDASPFDQLSASDPDFAARRLLLRTVARIAAIPGATAMPEYMLDLDVTKFLLQRLSFDGGGGWKKASAERVFDLIIDPRALADDIEICGKRWATRFRSPFAEEMEASYNATAQRVRQLAGIADQHLT